MAEMGANQLRKFLPFMDLVVDIKFLKSDLFAKWIELRSWIRDGIPFNEQTRMVEMVEQIIRKTYKDMLLQDVVVPKGLIKIFTEDCEIVQSVNLCSSDEENDEDQLYTRRENRCIDKPKSGNLHKVNTTVQTQNVTQNGEKLQKPQLSSSASRGKTALPEPRNHCVGQSNQYSPLPQYGTNSYQQSQPVRPPAYNYQQTMPTQPFIEMIPCSLQHDPRSMQQYQGICTSNAAYEQYASLQNYNTKRIPTINTHVSSRDPRMRTRRTVYNISCDVNAANQTNTAFSMQSTTVINPYETRNMQLCQPSQNNQSARTYGEYKKLKPKPANSESNTSINDQSTNKQSSNNNNNNTSAIQVCNRKGSRHKSNSDEINEILEHEKNHPTKRTPKAVKSKDLIELDNELKNLRCTVKGYEMMNDFSRIGTRRRSSVHALQLIEEQLKNDSLSSEESDTDLPSSSSLSSIRNKRKSNDSPQQTQENIVHSIRESIVRLKRLPQQIEKTTTGMTAKTSVNNELTSETVKSSEASTSKVTELGKKTMTKSNTPKQGTRKSNQSNASRPEEANTSTRMMEHLRKTCILCGIKPDNLTSHFVNDHQTESYVSRLGKMRLDYLKHNIPFVNFIPNGNKCSVECFFCKQLITDHFLGLYNHFSAHTGEYAYQCAVCDIKLPSVSQMQIHKQNKPTCQEKGMRTLYRYVNNSTTIALFGCNECNFLQLNRENIVQHLRMQHAVTTINANLIREYVLAAVMDQMPCSNDEASIVYDLDARVSIRNEPIDNDQECEQLAYFEPINNQGEKSILNSTVACYEQLSLLNAGNDEFRQHTPITTDPLDIKPDLQLLDNRESQNQDKKPHVFKYYPKQFRFFGFYKCDGEDCFFSTDEELELLEHLSSHSSSANPSKKYLHCAYCDFSSSANTASLGQELVAHIRLNHPPTRYQCTICCYRSANAYSVMYHSMDKHGPNEDKVYDCGNSQEKQLDEATHMQLIRESMMKTVTPFVCNVSDCTDTFYAINSWRLHRQQKHPLSSPEILEPMLCCIYCKKGFKTLASMRYHLSYKHPEKDSYYCKRFLKTGALEDSVSNLILDSFNIKVPAWKIINVHSNVISEAPSSQQSAGNHTEINKKELDLQESIKRSLLGLTYQTGVSPDALYRCCSNECRSYFSTFALLKKHIEVHGHQTNEFWLQCPHCTCKLSMDTMEEHLSAHRRHLFVCFHCGSSFGEEKHLKEHHKRKHADIKEMRIEKLPYNVTYSYRLLIDQALHTDRQALLKACKTVLSKQVSQQKTRERSRLQTKWEVDNTSVWLENVPKFMDEDKTVYKCPHCYDYIKITDIAKHFQNLHYDKISDRCVLSSCNRPDLTKDELLIDHIQCHASMKVFICGLCLRYDTTFFSASQHIQEEHGMRDVALILLTRSKDNTHVSLSMFFERNETNFSQTEYQNCFCCDRRHLKGEDFANHLEMSHSMVLDYFCATCDVKLNKKEAKKHYLTMHIGVPLKVRVEFKNAHNLVFENLRPLCVHIKDAAPNMRKRKSNYLKEDDMDADTDTVSYTKVTPKKKTKTVDEDLLQAKEERQLLLSEGRDAAAAMCDFSDEEQDGPPTLAWLQKQVKSTNKTATINIKKSTMLLNSASNDINANRAQMPVKVAQPSTFPSRAELVRSNDPTMLPTSPFNANPITGNFMQPSNRLDISSPGTFATNALFYKRSFKS